MDLLIIGNPAAFVYYLKDKISVPGSRLKIAFCQMRVTVCGRFGSNEGGAVVFYACAGLGADLDLTSGGGVA